MTDQPHLVVVSLAGLAVVALLLYLVTIYNSLIASRRYADREWANVDVLLKQRFDELPKLVELCKEYMQYEEVALAELTSARAAWMGARDVEAKASASRASTAGLRSLHAVAERYPALKANEQFVHLQKRLSELELQIADRREAYNEAVTNYNERIAQWPDLLVARPLGFQSMPVFESVDTGNVV